MTQATLDIIRDRVIAGDMQEAIAKDLQLSRATIQRVASAHGWRRPKRVCGVAVAAAPNRRKARKSSPDTMICANPPQNAPLAIPEIPPGATPEQFQSILAGFVQSLMSQGLANIEPPRNLAELEKLNAIHRKAAGLDKVGSGSGPSPLVAPMRTVSRRPVDVVTVEDDCPDWDSPVEI